MVETMKQIGVALVMLKLNRVPCCFVLLVIAFACGGKTEAAKRRVIRVGVAKVDVTPRGPVVLAGYGGRTKEHEGIDTRLWARAMVIGDKTPVAIVALDNCGVPAKLVQVLAKRLSQHGITQDRLVVASTHTHNAPSLVGYAKVVWSGRLSPIQARHVQEYTVFAIDRMAAAVVAALKAREPMHLEWAQGRATFGGNRRHISGGKWSGFGFQRSAPVDHSLPVLAARDVKGKIRAVWANYACHCTTVGGRNRVSGDWAGFANKWMEKALPQAISLMTIGCGADVGPQPSGNLQIAEQHGRSIAKEVKRLLGGKTNQLNQSPRVTSRRIKLPLAAPGNREFWNKQLRRGGFYQQQAKSILATLKETGTIAKTVDYPLSAWTFGEDLAIVFLAGEVVVDYSVIFNKELNWKKLWITAWSNDMPGYIPSSRVLAEGGYEPDFSQVYYAQPGRYAAGIEPLIVKTVKGMVGRSYLAKPDQSPAPFHQLPSREPLAFRRVAKWVSAKKTPNEAAILASIRKAAPMAQPAIDRLTRNDGQATEWYNFAGDFSSRAFIRQEKKGTELRWQTPAIVKSSKSKSTLCFMGGIGWRSQAKTEGFGLLVAGKERLRFDVTDKLARWRSKDGQVELLYLPTWTSNEDSAGFFFLQLPNNLVAEGKATTISVRSLGAGSLRWFAVDSKQNVPAKLKKLRNALKGTSPSEE